MRVYDLNLTLMIMINALVLNQGSAAKDLMQRGRGGFSFRSDRSDFFQPSAAKSKRGRRFRGGLRRNWYLNPIIIKLENVIDRYELKKSELEALYYGVKVCGLSKCEKFRGLIPENQSFKKFKCSGNQKSFKKTILKLLSDFQGGVQKIEKSFESLIEFEKLPNLNSGSRRKILEQFKTDVKTLDLEIETVIMNKRLSLERRSGVLASSLFAAPKFRTDLMIYEWRIIQDSKRFLREWRKNLQKIFKCWKKRKRQKAFEELRTNGLDRRSFDE